MKLLKLLLHAFGPFTGKTLDFSSGPVDLHLIYGPNEAGKSSALRAMMDLRFGIPHRSPDDFVHAAADLRIGGIFLTQTGEQIGLVRRKGKGATLARLDVETGQPDGALSSPSTYDLELTGGMERSAFEAMFGLNHARLREGGEVLLRGEGDVGSALFEASAGTSGIAGLLDSLEVDAKKLYSSHGRTQNAVINEARRRLDEQRQVWRDAQTKPAEWQSLNRAHEAAVDALAEVTRTLEARRRHEHELTELRTVEPLLREHMAASALVASCADIVDLPEQAREERLAALQALDHAQRSLREAQAEEERCALALQALALEPLLLEHAGAIERLVTASAAAAGPRTEARQSSAHIARLEMDLAVAAARIAPGRELRTMLEAVPAAADRLVLDDHLAQVGRLSDRLDEYRRRAVLLDEAGRLERELSVPVSDPAVRQRLLSAVRNAQSLGDVVRRLSEFDRQLRELEPALEQALSDVGLSSDRALRSSQPLLDAQIVQTRKDLGDRDDGIRKLQDEQKLVARDLDGQRVRFRQLSAEGEVVTAETLRQARAKRDGSWAAVRRVYIDQSQDREQLGLRFETQPSPVEIFEAAATEADRQADLLRADAKRAAGLEECSGRIEQMERRWADIERQIAGLVADREAVLMAWAGRLKDAGLPDLAPEPLREWQARRVDALRLAERVGSLRAERDGLRKEASEAMSMIAEVRAELGHPSGDPTTTQVQVLPSLIEEALRWEREAVEADAARSATQQAAEARRVEREQLTRSVADNERALLEHRVALRDWHTRLFLSSDTLPEAVKMRLDELDNLARQAEALSEARQRQAQVQALLDDVVAQSNQVAALLGEAAPQMADDVVDRLRTRLGAARAAEQERGTLLRDQRKAMDLRRRAASEQAAQQAALVRLCAAAGVGGTESLPGAEEAALRKREAVRALAQVRQQLAAASSCSDEDLRLRLAGRDAVAIESERERCRADITTGEEAQAAARRTEEQTRRALEAVDGSDRAALAREAMESAAARYRSAIRPWARLKLARALLQEAVRRFRERAKAPMMTKASAYFSLVTGGDYERLITDESGAQPLLCAMRAGGARVMIHEMSEGTTDQLYLALRLAALDVRRSAHPPMPLILDDALMTSDDRRASHILRALARFSEGGQVLVFTHHRHLLDVAREAIGEQAFVAHTL
ncbi:MAG: AAA family ATPase [Nitrospira sp.]|nr:AAA family ATPase [Nitrospira sp.]